MWTDSYHIRGCRERNDAFPTVSIFEDTMQIRFELNGKPLRVEVPSHFTLLRMLREKLAFTGTKEGCGIGECGACTVLLDGKPVHACLLMAAKVEGRRIETVEGLGTKRNLHPLQSSMIEKGAVQCGFCTPGILMSSKALLDINPYPTREQIKDAISGHLCRCTGYHQIIEAIEEAGKDRKLEARNSKLETDDKIADGNFR
jgi:aerobic carbon-monoxide dehydrogenase small subunit